MGNTLFLGNFFYFSGFFFALVTMDTVFLTINPHIRSLWQQAIALKEADVTIMSPLPVIAPCLKREKWIHSFKKTRDVIQKECLRQLSAKTTEDTKIV